MSSESVDTSNSIMVDTSGWDTVYSIFYPDVNQAIRVQKSSPPSFEREDEEDEMNLTGEFGDWQISTGGSGHNINMTIPVTSCHFEGLGKDVELTEIKFSAQVNLDWVAHPEADKFTHALTIDSTRDHTNVEIPKISLLENTDWGTNEQQKTPSGKPILTTLVKAAVKTLLGGWLAAHVDAFQHTFAALNLDQEIADKDKGFGWLKPTETSYAVAEIQKDGVYHPEQSVFSVLCMTQKRESPGVQQTSPFSIPADVNSSFVIRAGRLLDNLIHPGLHLMFDSASPDDFEINHLTSTISNKNTLKFQTQELKLIDPPGSIVDIFNRHVKPEVDPGNFSLRILGTYIELEFIDLHFTILPGMTCHITHTSRARLEINDKRQMQINVNTEDEGFQTTVSVTTSLVFDIVSIAATIALSIAGSIAGGFIGGAISKGGSAAASEAGTATATIVTEVAVEAAATSTSNLSAQTIGGAAAEAAAAAIGKAPQAAEGLGTMLVRTWPKLLGGIVGGTLGVAIGEIPKVVGMLTEDSAHDDMSLSLDQLVNEALTPIQWPNLHTEGFEIKNGQLNGAFVIGVDLHEKE